MARIGSIACCGAALAGLAGAVAWAQVGPGTRAWDDIQNRAAANRVRNDALRRHAGATSGGCARLPSGWAGFDVTIQFPAAYNGYPGWVNSAELLPAREDVKAYAAGGNSPDAYVRPALRAGPMAVRSSMCAPARQAYWLVVDSGTARVAVGRISLGPAPGPYRFALTAPPLQP